MHSRYRPRPRGGILEQQIRCRDDCIPHEIRQSAISSYTPGLPAHRVCGIVCADQKRDDLSSSTSDYVDVTEIAGDPVSKEQIDRVANRYVWAAKFCSGKDVVEAACGTGPGLALLNNVSRSLEAGDVSEAILNRVRANYGDQISLRQFDAQAMPFDDESKDVIVLFEAIYYLPSIEQFISECKRVLRPGGIVLLATANKDLPDFNASPHSYRYPGTVELYREFSIAGFDAELFGYLTVEGTSSWQRMLRPVKRAAIALNLMPKTMAGKRLLKRIVFGKPAIMPADITTVETEFEEPVSLRADTPNTDYKVLYCLATRI